jgi:hypothetical protein
MDVLWLLSRMTAPRDLVLSDEHGKCYTAPSGKSLSRDQRPHLEFAYDSLLAPTSNIIAALLGRLGHVHRALQICHKSSRISLTIKR